MPNESLRSILFDAYGTLFDVYSIGALADKCFPGAGGALAALWRERQLDYTRLRRLSDRYVDFLSVTEDALRYACARLRLELSMLGSAIAGAGLSELFTHVLSADQDRKYKTAPEVCQLGVAAFDWLARNLVGFLDARPLRSRP